MNQRIFMRALWIALAIEAVTLFFRFVLDMQSTRDTASTIGQLTFGLRIHHGYIGVALIGITLAVFPRRTAIYSWLIALGLGLFMSDIFHHFIVLWLSTGDPQFDLTYPSP